MTISFFPRWTLNRTGDVAPEERLPWGQTVAMGLQHVVAMFGATALAPILMGFDPNTAIFFSGIGTLIFFVATGGRLPSYLGSSFAFIAVVIAASGYGGSGPNANIPVALGGIFAAGLVYTALGAVVQVAGTGWVERLMPPAVTGAIVAAIGLNLAPVAVKGISGSAFDTVVGLVTAVAVGWVAVNGRGLARRLPILLGAAVGYGLYALGAHGFGWGRRIDFSGLAAAPWLGLPNFTAPAFEPAAMVLIAPVALVLVAENLGHVKALAAMTGRDFDPLIGRAFMADGVATMVSTLGGGTGVTTYAENMGVMAVTRIYSTLVFVVAALVVFGLIAATGGRIWVTHGTDFSRPRNLVTAAVALTAGAGDLTLKLGGFTLGGIGTATFGAIALYHLLGRGDDGPGGLQAVVPADAAVTPPKRRPVTSPKPRRPH